MNYSAYLFDFDYTLADSSRGIVTCFRNVFHRHQFSDITDEAIKRTIGKTLPESFSILTGITDPEQLAALQKDYSVEANIHMNANTTLFPETIAVLSKLKEQGAKIGIVSTKFRFRIQGFLKDYFSDDFFDVIIGGEDVSSHKPSPEGVLLAIERLGCTPEGILYIGDSVVDAETAQAAGVDFAGVLTGMTTADELRIYPHRAILANLSDLVPPPKQNAGKSRYRKYFQRKKWIAVRRMLHIRQIRGRSMPKANMEETTVCKNCGHTFTGQYCNNCAQDKDTGRFSFRSAVLNVLGGLSNIDRGFGYTLIELLYRPGYMISDFIAGKRVRYFRPFQTLFVLAAVYILLAQFIDPDTLKRDKDEKQTRQQDLTEVTDQLHMHLDTLQNESGKKESPEKIDKFVDELEEDLSSLYEKKLPEGSFIERVWNILKNWAHGNKALNIIITLPLFALATRMAFRKRTYNRGYNHTEHIFTQAYIACQILLISTILLVLRGKAEIGSLYDLSSVGIFVLYVWDYKQLFRGTWWQSLIRTLLMFIYNALLLIILAILVIAFLVAGTFLYKLFGNG